MVISGFDLPLFAYGTLGESQVQQILFGEMVPSEPATLDGWRVTIGGNPYLSLSPADGASTEGRLLLLSRAQLRIADQFEEIPFYRRIKVSVRRANGTELDAWVYTRPEDAGEPAIDKRPSALPDAQLSEDSRN